MKKTKLFSLLILMAPCFTACRSSKKPVNPTTQPSIVITPSAEPSSPAVTPSTQPSSPAVTPSTQPSSPAVTPSEQPSTPAVTPSTQPSTPVVTPTQGETPTVQPTVPAGKKVTITFYLDFNKLNLKEVYATLIARTGELVEAPNTPSEVPDPAFPVFLGWSLKEIIDDKADLFDFSSPLQTDSTALKMFGVWVAEGEN